MGNQNFGNPSALLSIDPDVRSGWGIRPSDWHFGVSLQQQIIPRVSVDVGLQSPLVQQLLRGRQPARGTGGLRPYTVTAPLASGSAGRRRLSVHRAQHQTEPGSRGRRRTTTRSRATTATRLATGTESMSALNARPCNGLFMKPARALDVAFHDNCDIVAALPETLGANQRAGVEGCRSGRAVADDRSAAALSTRFPKRGRADQHDRAVPEHHPAAHWRQYAGTNGPSLRGEPHDSEPGRRTVAWPASLGRAAQRHDDGESAQAG